MAGASRPRDFLPWSGAPVRSIVLAVGTDRLRGLADGVFAIALTLLVLDLPVPEDSTDLAADLLDAWPSFAGYAVSFATVAIVWVNHHGLVDAVVATDRTLLELDLVLLLFVSLVPWPTGLLAAHLRDPAQARIAAVVYGLVMTTMAGTFTLIWARLARTQQLVDPAHRPRLRTALRRSAVGPAAYAVATAVALVSAPVAVGLFGALAGWFAVSGRTRPTSAPAVGPPPEQPSVGAHRTGGPTHRSPAGDVEEPA